MEVICNLESTSFSKEALEISRLGKIVNELRKRTEDRKLAVRAKNLVKKWRQDHLPPQTNDIGAKTECTNNTGKKRNANGLFPERDSKKLRKNDCYISNGLDSVDDNSNLSSTPDMGKLDNVMTNFINDKGNLVVKYSKGLPSYIFGKQWESVSEPCSPIDFNVIRGSYSNPCSPIVDTQSKEFQPTGTYYRENEQKISHAMGSGVIENGCKISEALVKGQDLTSIKVAYPSHVNAKHVDMPKKSIDTPPSQNHKISKCTASDSMLCKKQLVESLSPSPSSPIKLRSRSKLAKKEDILKQQIQSASRNGKTGKIKTTEEIAKDLMSSHLAFSGPAQNETTLNTREVCRLPKENRNITSCLPHGDVMPLNQLHEARGNVTHFESSTSLPQQAISKETPEEVLSRLPQLDFSQIRKEILAEIEKEACEAEEITSTKDITSIEVSKCVGDYPASLTDGNVECLNGNYAYDGKFRKWNSLVSKYSTGKSLLHILPYTIID